MKLKKIDLSKISGCEHPDLKQGIYYLAKIDGRWYAGTFTRQWYGWNYSEVYPAGYQLDYGRWEQLYEIVDDEVKTLPVIFDILNEAMVTA